MIQNQVNPSIIQPAVHYDSQARQNNFGDTGAPERQFAFDSQNSQLACSMQWIYGAEVELIGESRASW